MDFKVNFENEYVNVFYCENWYCVSIDIIKTCMGLIDEEEITEEIVKEYMKKYY